MIYVPRPFAPPAEVTAELSKVSRSGKSELDSARNYYSTTPPPVKCYGFKQYKSEAVCIWLDELFNGKCAYCESRYSAVGSRNVEHYRPKGAVTEQPAHPGYWWLASDWKNLMPSCPACNQFRKHVIYEQGMSLAELESKMRKPAKGRGGKGNAFPMMGIAQWSMHENQDLSIEAPLLIDPMIQNPNMYLEWSFDWDKAMPIWNSQHLVPFLRPRVVSGSEAPQGIASIATYGLNRGWLVRERVERIKLMQMSASSFVNALTLASKAQGSPIEDDTRVRATEERIKLYKFAEIDQPYSGMAQAFIKMLKSELSKQPATSD